MKIRFAALGVAALTAAMTASVLPAQAKISEVFYGRVVHVSADNIKVKDPATGKILSFVFVPGVAKVVEDTGNPSEMADVHKGEPVKIVYDTTALGARHLDRIVTLHNGLPHSYHNKY